MEGAMKSYLNPHDRFAQRMKASMRGSKAETSAEAQQQQNLFVDSGNVDLEKNGDESKYISDAPIFVFILFANVCLQCVCTEQKMLASSNNEEASASSILGGK